MKVQNIDLSPILKKDTDKSKRLSKWLIIGLSVVVFGFLTLTFVYLRNYNHQASPQITPTPIITQIPEPTEPVSLSDIEVIRQMWIDAKNTFLLNDYNNNLLLPPLIELELSLDE